jgi:hypothetical protein
MRVENTKVKITIPIPVGKPDCNGVVYTEEAVENALNNLQTNLPIIYKEDAEGYATVIGATTGTSHIVTWDSENQVCKLTVDGVIFHSGVYIMVNEIEDGKITDFSIASIGLTI